MVVQSLGDHLLLGHLGLIIVRILELIDLRLPSALRCLNEQLFLLRGR